MRLRIYVVLTLLLSMPLLRLSTTSASETPEIDVALAAQYFREAAELAAKDAGKLWGISLAGPMLFADRKSRAVVANERDPGGKLQMHGEVFTGTLPPEVNAANTATEWSGVKWTMILWPLPESRRERLQLMAHELFHRIQDQLKLTSTNVANSQLDSQQGRTWLRMEWLALERALEERGPARIRAIADAICFRRYRQSLFATSKAEECALESNEGLAEYTGLTLSARSEGERASRAGYGLRRARFNQTFTRSFAYASGPAYGVLLDAEGIRWRSGFRAGGDLSELLERGLGLRIGAVSATAALARSKSYDGDEVIADEIRRETTRVEQGAKYRAKLLDGPVLVIGIGKNFNYSFDPNNLIPLDDVGTIYPTMRVTDDWGVLEVSDGALLIREGAGLKRLQVAAPKDLDARPIVGPGWKLELNKAWTIAAGDRRGDVIIQKRS
jgi:hypothetical protein